MMAPGAPHAAVVGWPVSHSLSPLMMTCWLEQTGLRGRYDAIAIAPEDFSNAVRNRFGAGLVGANITVPHKAAALAAADAASDAAEAIGAANVLLWREDGLYADNTDIVGIERALTNDDGTEPAVLIGAGGAARAALYHLSGQDREIRIMNRTRASAEALAAEFGVTASVHSLDDAGALDGAGLVINATSLGMTGQPPLRVDLGATRPSAVVFDMVYAPLETGLLTMARALGRTAVDGLVMLVGQARPAFDAFFGGPAPLDDAIRKTLLAALEARA